MKKNIQLLLLFMMMLMASCATPSYNYDKFRAANPRSILILPPINKSTDVRGTYGYLSTVTMPVAEKGFYVYPVALIDEMMKENGLPSANEMHQVSLKKIKEIINPDAILYLTLEKYGTTFAVLSSHTTVSVSGKLISAITGEVLWEGSATVTPDNSSSSSGGLLGSLVSAVITQAANNATDNAHEVSAQANEVLFATEGKGLLNGPYFKNPQ